MLKRCSFVLAFFVVALCPLVSAQQTPATGGDPTQAIPEAQRASREDVERFFTAMRMRKNMEMIFQAMREQMKAMPQKMMPEKLAKLPPEDRKKVQDAVAANMEEAFNSMPLDDLISDMIPVYQRYLSKEDLKGITTFYSSPVGQRLLDKTPAMTAEAMQVSMDRMQKMMPAMMERARKRMDEVMSEIENKNTSTPPEESPNPSKS